VAALLVAAICVEYLPDALPITRVAIPRHVEVLRDLPDKGAVVDLQARPGVSLYYQTIHRKRLAFGYTSREPASLKAKRVRIEQLAASGRYHVIGRERGFAYLVVDAGTVCPLLPLLYQDATARIYACSGARAPGSP